jgi:hypothetical protein
LGEGEMLFWQMFSPEKRRRRKKDQVSGKRVVMGCAGGATEAIAITVGKVSN